MANTMSTKEIREFAKKLATWSESLTDNERTLLNRILEDHGRKKRSELSNQDLKALLENNSRVQPFEFANVAPKLDARAVEKMCW